MFERTFLYSKVNFVVFCQRVKQTFRRRIAKEFHSVKTTFLLSELKRRFRHRRDCQRISKIKKKEKGISVQ